MSSLIEQKVITTPESMTKEKVYPGYPTKEHRLHVDPSYLDTTEPLVLADGEWTIGKNIPPTLSETEAFRRAGYNIDSVGRPLHPDIKNMLTDPEIGVVTGQGRYWHWGPNFTADPVILAGPRNDRHVLLIKRGDTGHWALPGGFVDGNELAVEAARREAGEEAGIFDLGEPVAELYRGIVTDLRTTANAWGETAAYLWQLDSPVTVQAGDDAVQVQWFNEHELPDGLYGSHADLIKRAFEYSHKVSLKDILDLPPEYLTITPADGGHMAYDHLFIDGPRDRLFIKAHDPDQFTDTFREKHSRDYLYKEQFYFDHLRSVGYSAIPERTELIDGTILAMDALRIEDNWLWRAPKNELFDTYVTDVLNAFDSLATVKPPETSYHQDINPTYPTLWIEGWNDLSNTKVKAVREKIGLFMRQFPIHSHGYALDLSRSILELRDASLAYTPPTEYVVSHNDARQSNIAWHPKKGVKIVDWSWADQAPKGADATMFLIDLAKSGHDVSKYLNNYFVVDHAKTLIGFWLAHSLWETRDGSSTVRMHQIASAVYAFKLINDVYED